MSVEEKASRASAKLSVLAESRPDLAPVVRAAAEIVDVVVASASETVKAAGAQASSHIRLANESTAAFEKVAKERDEAVVRAANAEMELSALKFKSAQAERERVERVAVAKAERAEEVSKAEAVALQTAIAVEVIKVYLWKRVFHTSTRKSFVESPKRMSGPWELTRPDGRVVLYETRQDVVEAARELVLRTLSKSVPSEDDPMNQSHLDAKKKPPKYPEVGEEMGSNDTFDSKTKSERVAVAKRASGKRTPKWKR